MTITKNMFVIPAGLVCLFYLRNMASQVKSLDTPAEITARVLSQRSASGQGVHVISLLSLGRDFTIDSTSLSAVPFDVTPKVTAVQWDGNYWTVTFASALSGHYVGCQLHCGLDAKVE